MKWTKKMKGAGKKAAVTVTALGMVLTAFPPIPRKLRKSLPAVDKRRVSGKRQQGQYRCCEIQWWRYSAAYVS